MSDSVKDVKISKIQTSDGEQHEINARYWGGLETADFYNLKSYIDQIVSGGIKFRGVFIEKPDVVYDEETNQYITYSDDENNIIWNVGDVIIVTRSNETLGEPTKEYILTFDGDSLPVWVELGDVSATDQRLTMVEKELKEYVDNNFLSVDGDNVVNRKSLKIGEFEIATGEYNYMLYIPSYYIYSYDTRFGNIYAEYTGEYVPYRDYVYNEDDDEYVYVDDYSRMALKFNVIDYELIYNGGEGYDTIPSSFYLQLDGTWDENNQMVVNCTSAWEWRDDWSESFDSDCVLTKTLIRKYGFDETNLYLHNDKVALQKDIPTNTVRFDKVVENKNVVSSLNVENLQSESIKVESKKDAEHNESPVSNFNFHSGGDDCRLSVTAGGYENEHNADSTRYRNSSFELNKNIVEINTSGGEFGQSEGIKLSNNHTISDDNIDYSADISLVDGRITISGEKLKDDIVGSEKYRSSIDISDEKVEIHSFLDRDYVDDSTYISSNLTVSPDGVYVNDKEVATVDQITIVKGDKDNSAVLGGEYEGYSNKAISQVSVAVGAASTSGLKGWYYDAITFDDTNKVYKIYIKYQNKLANGTGITTSNNTTTQPKMISTSSGSTNSSFKSGYEVGDVISLVNDKKYEDCSTITAINGNVLTVDKLPFTKNDMKTSSLASIAGYETPDEFSIYCIKRDFNNNTKLLTLSKYDQGDVDFGGGSLSEGVQTYAVNIGAHAEGAQTVAKGQYSHAEGIRTIANYASHAEGGETIASGSRCHAEGYKNEASGDYSHVEGDNNVASGVSSHAEGYNTRATNNQSHAEGGSTNATGKQSHAEGWSTTASGLHAHAEGGYTIASAWNSHAGGNYSEANGNNSFAHGDHVNTTNVNEVAFGQYNKSESDTLFSIGNGTDENNRSNILEVKSIENDSEVKYEYFAPSGDITFYYYDNGHENRDKALVVSYFDQVGEYARYKVEFISSLGEYNILNFVGDNLNATILNIKQSDGFLYLPLDQKPQCEIDKAEIDNDFSNLIEHSYRMLYISTDFTEENVIVIINEYDYSNNVVMLQYSEHKTNNSALFVNGQRVLVEGNVNESKDWSDDINNAKKQAISESNTYTDSKIFISRNTSSTGIIDTGCIYKDEEIKNVAKGYCSVAIGAGVLSKSDGAITLGWSDTKTVSSDSTLSTNDDYLTKWKELTNVTDETIGSTTQAGFSASLGNNSVSLGRNNLSVGPQSTAIGMRNLSIGNHAVALGGYNIARGHDSVAMGQGCITNNTGSGSSNRGEFACGRFNKSVSDTQFSLGIGTSATKRKNALEIKTNGKHYIYGVGGYEGTNSNDSNDIATVLSNISKDIDDIKSSNVVEIDNAPEVLSLSRSGDLLEVNVSNDRLLDYVSVTQGSDTQLASFYLVESTIKKHSVHKTVYCAYRNDGTTGGTDLTSGFVSFVNKDVYEQTLTIKFEEYVTVQNATSIDYAKCKVVSASCVEADGMYQPKYNKPYCYLRANTFKTAGYTGTYMRYETIIVREGDYVYITKEFLDSKIALDPYSQVPYCSSIDYYQLFGEDDVSNGNLFVQVKYNSGNTVGYPMLGVNIVCDSIYPTTTTVDSDLEEIDLGGINYCTSPYIDGRSIVVQLHRHFDIIVNNIDDTINDVAPNINIIMPPKDSIHLYKPMKFINNYNPNEPSYKFIFQFENNGVNIIPQKFVEYEKTDLGYVRKSPYTVAVHAISASTAESDISFKITEFCPITSLVWNIIDNVSL